MTNIELKNLNNTTIRAKTQPNSISKTDVADALDNLVDYVDQESQSQDISGKENSSNKSINVVTDGASDVKYPSVKAVKTYADGLVVGLLNDRGSFNASVNTFPATGGSGSAGAILKGDLWFISVAGTLGGVSVPVGASVRALANSPGQTSTNWNILNVGLGYTAENVLNKSTNVVTDATSNAKYPSVKAVKDYVDANVSGLSSSLKVAQVTITQAEILNVSGFKKELVSSVAGKVMVPVSIVAYRKVGGTAYTISNSIRLNTVVSGSSATIASSTIDTVFISAVELSQIATFNTINTLLTSGNSLHLASGTFTSPNVITGGTGDLVVCVNYIEITA